MAKSDELKHLKQSVPSLTHQNSGQRAVSGSGSSSEDRRMNDIYISWSLRRLREIIWKILWDKMLILVPPIPKVSIL